MKRHLIRSQDLDQATIREIFDRANLFKRDFRRFQHSALSGKIMCSLFYEPSTRTRLSFESAHLRLGGSVIGTDNAGEFSSAIKGETLEDSIRVISGYADVIVLRHPENDAAERAAAISSCPVVNAGNGTGQHPTQSLIDLYTIESRLGGIDGITIAIAGDLRHGRTARSLAYLLGRYSGVTIHFVAPDDLQIGRDILDYLGRHGVRYHLVEHFGDSIGHLDVIYQTRLQRERHGPSRLAHDLTVDAKLVGQMKPGSIVMHPLPRNDEISDEVDGMPNAAYFEQAANGLFVRMSLLEAMLIQRAR